MRIRVSLTPEEVRKAIESYVSSEMNKHGHPGERKQSIFFKEPERDWKPLDHLEIEVEGLGEV